MSNKNIALIFSQFKRIENGRKSASSSILTVFTLSCLVNVLFLTGPIFMMQVYDRVLGSGNIATLIGLYVIAFLLYVMMGLFDTLRQQIGTLRGEEVASQYDGPAFQATLEAKAAGVIDERSNAPEDVEVLRNFITSPGMMTFFDLPAIPFYFLAIMVLHPILGLVAIGAGTILSILAAINDRQSRKNMANAQSQLGGVSRILSTARQDAESIRANGMGVAVQDFWQGKQAQGRSEMISTMRVTSAFGSVTKALRMAIQSLVLAVGGWLAVIGVLSPGAMIAASIVFSRSIAPLEQLLNNFRNLSKARTAWANIQQWAPDYLTNDKEEFNLPAPHQSVVAQNLSVKIPSQNKNLLTGITTELVAGDVLVIIGPSGVGKTSLLRTIVGAWSVSAGTLRLDGAELSQWSSAELGNHIGYLSQYTQLLNGTVAQNISRFRPDTPSDQIIAAAQIASVHDMIVGFEQGYETMVGDGAVQLSGGQRQRIGLARALFGGPFLTVLDEPTAHLDNPGKIALAQALLERRKAGKITVLTSHDELVMKLATKIMVLEKGQMSMSGPKDAVLKKLTEMKAAKTPTQSAPIAAPTPIAGPTMSPAPLGQIPAPAAPLSPAVIPSVKPMPASLPTALSPLPAAAQQSVNTALRHSKNAHMVMPPAPPVSEHPQHDTTLTSAQIIKAQRDRLKTIPVTQSEVIGKNASKLPSKSPLKALKQKLGRKSSRDEKFDDNGFDISRSENPPVQNLAAPTPLAEAMPQIAHQTAQPSNIASNIAAFIPHQTPPLPPINPQAVPHSDSYKTIQSIPASTGFDPRAALRKTQMGQAVEANPSNLMSNRGNVA